MFFLCSIETLVAPTQDLGKILSALHAVPIEGELNLLSGVQVAQLALKHRQNKHQRQRIVIFVGSPVSAETKALEKIGKKLKKNNVAVDVVNFGEEASNTEKLEAFVNAVNKDDNSHLLTVPPGPHVLSDLLLSSSIVQDSDGGGGGEAAAGGGGGGGGGGFDFGVDPSLDPELAMALRISMEEARQRQDEDPAAADAAAGGEAGAGEVASMDAADDDEMDEDALLAQAIAMSMAGDGGGAPAAGDGDIDDIDEDEAMALALQMSMGEGAAPADVSAAAEGGDAGQTELNAALQDPEFLNEILSSLPGGGVDLGDGAAEDKKEDEAKK